MGLGEVCHNKTTMPLPGRGSQITEAPCPNSRAQRPVSPYGTEGYDPVTMLVILLSRDGDARSLFTKN